MNAPAKGMQSRATEVPRVISQLTRYHCEDYWVEISKKCDPLPTVIIYKCLPISREQGGQGADMRHAIFVIQG